MCAIIASEEVNSTVIVERGCKEATTRYLISHGAEFPINKSLEVASWFSSYEVESPTIWSKESVEVVT